MLPLSEIARLAATVDAQWHSPVADAASAAWGRAAGTALFWRSSACHVFVVLDESGTHRQAFLRLMPAHLVRPDQVETIAALTHRLANQGLAVARALPSSAGRLVETIETGEWRGYAMMLANAPGEQLDPETLSPERAEAWGAALGRLHRDGDAAASGLALPDGFEQADRAFAILEGDVCAEAVEIVHSRLRALPRGPDQYGLIHGDFELDNLAWSSEHPVAFDWDEAERSWFAADIAKAVEELVPEPNAWVSQPLPLLDAFLDGYERERPSERIDRPRLALFAAHSALRSLARLRPVLAEAPDTGGDLASPPDRAGPRPLRSVLDEHAERMRTVASTLAPLAG